MWVKIKSKLSLISDLLQIGGFLGFTPAIFVTTACTLIGLTKNISAYYLFFGAILIFAASAYLLREFNIRIGTISLTDASRQAYEELRGTLWGHAAEKLRVDHSPEGVLDYIGTGLTLEIPLFGKYPPSRRLEQVKLSDVKSGSIEGGASILQLRDQHKSKITDLTIRKSDLWKTIRKMKEAGKEFP
jgi:vacuolar-type H+-ATPase subunit I/STV1